MPFKQVSNCLGRYRKVLTVARFEECKVVMKGAKALHFAVNMPIQLFDVHLTDFVLALDLKLIFQPDQVVEHLRKLLARLGAEAKVGLERVADDTVVHATVNILGELSVARLH